MEGPRDRLANVAAECRPIRQAFVATLQRVVELGYQSGERKLWAKTKLSCLQLLSVADAHWTFLEKPGVEPTNNAAERVLRQAVIQRKISNGFQSATGSLCRSRLQTVTASLQQQGRDVWGFLEQAWVTHRLGGEMPPLVPDRCARGSSSRPLKGYLQSIELITDNLLFLMRFLSLRL